MDKVKVLESKYLREDVYFLRINYLGKEYADTVSISGLELALISLPKEKAELRGIFQAYKQAVEQIITPEKETEAEAPPRKYRKPQTGTDEEQE